MRSPMIEAAEYISDEAKRRYSDVQVLRSNAGYYLGTTYDDPDTGQEPGSRDSGYFAHRADAEAALRQAAADGGKSLRLTP